MGRNACSITYIGVSIFLLFLMTYYIYKGIEYGVRVQIMRELSSNVVHGCDQDINLQHTLQSADTSHHQLSLSEQHDIAGRVHSMFPGVMGFPVIDTKVYRSAFEGTRPEANGSDSQLQNETNDVDGGGPLEVKIYHTDGYGGRDTVATAPPLDNVSDNNYEYPNNWDGYNIPPPSYTDVVKNGIYSETRTLDEDHSGRGILNRNELEWHQVFEDFNKKRMAFALEWTPPPAVGRPLENCLKEIDAFLEAPEHPVGEQAIYRFLKSFVALTNLVYAETTGSRRTDGALPRAATSPDTVEHREKFLTSFRLLMEEYMPKEVITNRIVPFHYDWFIFSGRITYAVINAHITLCSIVEPTVPYNRPYYSKETLIGTEAVVQGLKNICTNFTESLGYQRYGSNRIYIGAAFLYASLLDKARVCLSATGASHAGRDLPDYVCALNEILDDPVNRYDTFDSLIGEIGKQEIVPPNTDEGGKSVQRREAPLLPAGAQRGDTTYDGVYDDRTFFAHRRLRMYAYIHSYCEQLPAVQVLLRERRLDDKRLSVLLRAVEPMSDEGALFYFNLHSRAGGFKYRNGSAMFTSFGMSKFRTETVGAAYGRIYVADKARILFVQSGSFTFHSIGQLSDLAFGEVEKSNRDLMPAWLMGQRPLFRSEKNRLVDVPCGSHLEPCVVDTGKSKGLTLDPIKRRNTTDYTPTEASAAVVAFEEAAIGAVFTDVREVNMDVSYSRCTVATPFYTFTTYFRMTRFDEDETDKEPIRLSCYTGCVGKSLNSGSDFHDDDHEGKESTFRHCTVKVFVQNASGRSYSGDAVTLTRQTGIDRRVKSKSKYKREQLENVSVSTSPYGLSKSTILPGSITVLYRPRDCKEFPVPKSLLNQNISPRVTVREPGIYRVDVDSRYVVYCDVKRNVVVLLDAVSKRVCIAPVCKKLQDDCSVPDTPRLLATVSSLLNDYTSEEIALDFVYKNRIYAYFHAGQQ